MRRAKDNQGVPKRYYHPEQKQCPCCGQELQRAYPWWRKYIVFLSGRELVISLAYRCRNRRCRDARRGRMHTSRAAERLTLRGSSFALELIAQIGYWRFWQRWTVAQIHERLSQERQLPISERAVLYLIGVFLVLMRCTYQLRWAEYAAEFRRHGLFLAIDALKPEKGNRALYVVRELKHGLVVHHVSLLNTDQRMLAKHLLQPVKALDYRIRGLVSDDERPLRLAIAQVWPSMPHQTCQVHCLRDAAQPIIDADRAFKTSLKKAFRAAFYAAGRALAQLAVDDPYAAVLLSYADLIRSTLTEDGKPPFALGGLRVFEDLTRLDASLRRSREKGGMRAWSSCSPWCNAANRSARAIANSSANAAGWLNWNGGSTQRTAQDNHARALGRSNNASKSFWRSWSSTRELIPRTRPSLRTSRTPLSNAGPDCLRAMPGRNATVRTMNSNRSSDDCARGSDKFMDTKRCMSSCHAMANGPSIWT